MSVAPQVNVPILGWKIAGTSAGATGGILKYTPTAEVIAPQVNVYVAPQVDVPILGWKIAGTSAGATGGILKLTPAECRRNNRRYTPPCRQA